MPTYAIGDIQGCFEELQRLLDEIAFDPATDRLWFTGDLVNRGPRSLDVLRFVRSLGKRAITVLGNHDLHLLAVAEGLAPKRHDDTLDAILAAPDRDELLDWLRRRPLLHRDEALGFTLIHAGLPPQWDMDTAAGCAREVEAVLRGERWRDLPAHMYGDEPSKWHPGLSGHARLRFITNSLTRLRYVTRDGSLALKPNGAPGSQPQGCLPWFQAPERRSRGERIIFGHWSQLGRIHWPKEQVYGIDTGCVWGNTLTALRLAPHGEPVESGWSQPSESNPPPGSSRPSGSSLAI